MKNQHKPQDSYQAIWRMIAAIPYGMVATYGQIAELVGLPRRARLVGYALHRTPADIAIPWYRVINAKGMISFPKDSEPYQRQRDLLSAEGVEFINACVDLQIYRWQPDVDELLWKPQV